MWFSRTTICAGYFGRLSGLLRACNCEDRVVQCVSLSVEGARTGKSRSQASIVLEGFWSLAKRTIFGRSSGAPSCGNWMGVGNAVSPTCHGRSPMNRYYVISRGRTLTGVLLA